MGSGYSGLYSGTSGSSQPYSPSYAVVEDMMNWDIERGIYDEFGYGKNPTARNIEEYICGNYIIDKNTNGIFTYVIDLKGKIIIGRRNGNGSSGDPTPHPTLIGGKNPKVQMAGILEIRGGKIYSYDNKSGHFKPNIKSMEVADEIFSKLPAKLFHKRFKRRLN